jgi:chromosome partitioning protein
MTAKIIALVNRKGGAGKTMLACQLAGTLGARGYRTAIVDTDAQGTATRWVLSAPDDRPFPARVIGLAAGGARVHREVERFAPDFDVLIVDCPPSVESPVPQSALMIADLALVPVIPAPADIWAAEGILDLIERAPHELAARIVPNMVQGTNLARATLEQLAKLGVELARARLGSRTAYRQSTLLGQTVHGMDEKASAEVDALADEVIELVGLEPFEWFERKEIKE